jgi:hypothetical protein
MTVKKLNQSILKKRYNNLKKFPTPQNKISKNRSQHLNKTNSFKKRLTKKLFIHKNNKRNMQTI